MRDNDVSVKRNGNIATLLLVDDENAILSALRSLFRKEGYTLQICESAIAALQFLESHFVQVILTDMRMPEMNGEEFLRRAAALSPETVRIMMSGYEEKHVILDALANGLGHSYTIKPWDDADLKGLVRRGLQRYEDEHALRLHEMLGSLNQLPAPPSFHGRLLTLLENEHTSHRDILEEIEKSPPLVTKLLGVANSVLLGARHQLTSLDEALRFVGVEYLGSLVVGLGVFGNASSQSDPQTSRIVAGMWEHAVRRASIARAIGKRTPDFKDHSLLYIAALLLDIGLVLRLASETMKYMEMTGLALREGISLYEAERRLFAPAHDQLGAAVLEYWNLPRSVVQPVACHHGTVGENVIARIAQIADRLMDVRSADPYDTSLEQEISAWCNLDPLATQNTPGQP
jgi:HD-like signal output (HDOD) protein